MEGFNKDTDSGHAFASGSRVSAAFKKETIGNCEIHHKNLTYGDTTIHFAECGNPSGDLVVLVHGFPNFWFLWKNQLQVLATKGFHVIAPDLRGYNMSSKPMDVNKYGVAHVLEDMVQLIDCCSNSRPAYMIGHDWGGVIVWAFAEFYSNWVKKIIIINAPHFHAFRNLWRHSILCALRQGLRSWYFVFFQLPGIPEAFFRYKRFWAFREGLQKCTQRAPSEDDVNRYVEAYSVSHAISGMLNHYRALGRGYWKEVGYNIIQIPVKVIWGEMDLCLESQLAYPPKHLVPDATVLFMPKASHWPMWDEPESFNKAILDFLIGCG